MATYSEWTVSVAYQNNTVFNTCESGSQKHPFCGVLLSTQYPVNVITYFFSERSRSKQRAKRRAKNVDRIIWSESDVEPFCKTQNLD